MNPDRARLVAYARETIAKGSKSFAAASRLFDPVTRDRAQLLYAWCRACDDIADGQVLGHGMTPVAEPQVWLARMRDLTTRALGGEETGQPAFDALGIVAAETALPARFAHDLIDGFALDARDWRPRTEDDLYRYCYHVAGAVGCMMAAVMGVPATADAVLDRACDLGLAFQLANIARDIGEDAAAGRCYLPSDWLDEVDVRTDELTTLHARRGLAVLRGRLAARAARYEASARCGAVALSYRSAWAVLSAAGIYGDIAREVARRGEHAWDERVATSRADKLMRIAGAAWQAGRRGAIAPVSRDGLWTRPRWR